MTFIGPVPVVDTPRFVTPFYAEDDTVWDARGARVAVANTPGYADDNEMARAIADALNEKYGPKPAEAPETKTIEVVVYPHVDGRNRWLVVDGKAYFQNSEGTVRGSLWTPEELEDGSASPAVTNGVTVADIDPAILEGVTGTR